MTRSTGLPTAVSPIISPAVVASFDDLSDSEPDPARSYERAKPLKEYGDSRLDCDPFRPCAVPDQIARAVHNAHEATQLNAESTCDSGASCPLE